MRYCPPVIPGVPPGIAPRPTVIASGLAIAPRRWYHGRPLRTWQGCVQAKVECYYSYITHILIALILRDLLFDVVHQRAKVIVAVEPEPAAAPTEVSTAGACKQIAPLVHTCRCVQYLEPRTTVPRKARWRCASV